MKRLLLAAALLGTLTFAATAPAQAGYYRRRPVARAAARVALPPYARPWHGPGYYPMPPRVYGPPSYGYYGPSYYGPRVYLGIGVY